MHYAPTSSKPLYIKIGAEKHERILNATDAPSEKIYLPGLHAFSGCDSTSWFHGIPKGLLGKTLQIEDDLFDMIKSIVCQAYGFLSKSNVNDVPYEKRCGKKFPEPSEILSTKDGLDQHVTCINYQEFVWKNAFEANQKIPEADQHSWSGIDGTYEVQ